MRRLALAITFACVFSVTAWAGEIHSGDAPAPPPPSTVTTMGEIDTTGEIHSSDAPAPAESDTVLAIILTLITIVS